MSRRLLGIGMLAALVASEAVKSAPRRSSFERQLADAMTKQAEAKKAERTPTSGTPGEPPVLGDEPEKSPSAEGQGINEKEQ